MGLGSFLGGLGSFIPGIGPVLGAIGTIAGGAAKNRAEGRASEAGFAQNADRNQIAANAAFEQALRGRGQLDLDQRQFAENAPSRRLTQSGLADAIQNIPAALAERAEGPTVSNVGGRNITSFGIDPSTLYATSGQTSDLAGLVRDRALSAQQAGDTFDPLPPIKEFTPTDLPQPSGFDTFLGGVAGVGGVVEGINRARKKRREEFVDEPLEGRRFSR